MGASCWGIDSTQGFIDKLTKDIRFQNRLSYGKLPILNIEFGFKFDVIISIAVIMHLKIEEIKEWIKDIKNYLADDGKVILSYSTTLRVGDDRFFEDLNGEVVNDIFLDNGFKLIEENCTYDGLNRDIEWWNGIYTTKFC